MKKRDTWNYSFFFAADRNAIVLIVIGSENFSINFCVFFWLVLQKICTFTKIHAGTNFTDLFFPLNCLTKNGVSVRR